MRLRAALCALLLPVFVGAPYALAAPVAAALVVSPDGPYFTIEAALAEARPGDTLEVRGGVYSGPLVIEVSGVTLEGIGWPVVDGGGHGTVVTLAAPDVTLRGFEVRGSGVEPDRDHAGIAVTAPRVIVENNRLTDVLFGIFVAQADDAVIRGNDITGKAEYDLGRKGDGLRLWYSRGVLVENNTVRETRDVVIWYSTGVVLRGNRIERGRYGVHLMYCDDAQITGNELIDNSVGVYTMYSNRVVLRDNLVRGQRGPSGYALGFKDADDVEAAGNVLVDNRAGIFLDGTPFSPQGHGRFHDNVLAYNDVGAILLPAVRGAAFTGNTFWENAEQVAVQGGGTLGENEWRGNFWSDYAGFDARGDGRGDTPYRAERLFENLTDRAPGLRALIYSPAAQAIEFTASAFPVVRPQPKLTDPEPLVNLPPLPPAARMPRRGSSAGQAMAATALAGLAALGVGRMLMSPGKPMKRNPSSPGRACAATGGEDVRLSDSSSGAAVGVREVYKRYGPQTVLNGISFTGGAGEALALWGENGAGKTTLLKAMLGLIEFEGDIQIGGHDVRRDGKQTRRRLGYVPQEAVFYDLSVQATLDFYARLKRVGPERIPPLLARLDLAAHAAKPVPALSGGLKQRLALALALLADPPVLLLDEPTASLDAEAQRDYILLLRALRDEERKMIIFASHRREEVEALATRVLYFKEGRLAELPAAPAETAGLALWVDEAHRQQALRRLTEAGMNARLNGRGTVVVQVRPGGRLRPVQALYAAGIEVQDFDDERGGPWNSH